MDINKIKCFLLDLDGTVYLSGKLIDGVKETITRMRTIGRVLFLTNNSSKSRMDYVKKLNSLGIDTCIDDIYSSSLATIELIKPQKPNVYLVGTKSLKDEFIDSGINVVNSFSDDLSISDFAKIDTVVVGFDTQLNYQKLLVSARLIKRGVRYIATHPDLNCPDLDGDMPDVGALIALINASTNRNPDIICGKPYSPMAKGIMRLVDCAPSQVLMVGDRLYTDMQFAQNNGFCSALVLSGETTMSQYQSSQVKVDLVVDSISDLV